MSGKLSKGWVKIQEVKNLDGVRVLTTRFVVQREMPRHLHQEYVFGLAIKGAAEIDCGHCREKHIFQSGDLMFTQAHEVYASRTLGKPPWQNYSFSIEQKKLASLLEFAADGKQIELPHYIQGAVQNEQLRRLFLKLRDSLTTGQSPLEQESLLLDWVVSVQQNYAEQRGSSGNQKLYSETAAIRRVREFITENYAENIKLQNLAEIARLSPFHLNRVFTAQIGLPPHTFQNQLRIEQARNLIREKKSFSEIAAQTGFADQSHFNRFFKRYTGVTPKRFFTE